jgi:hypothetical protein
MGRCLSWRGGGGGLLFVDGLSYRFSIWDDGDGVGVIDSIFFKLLIEPVPALEASNEIVTWWVVVETGCVWIDVMRQDDRCTGKRLSNEIDRRQPPL